MTTQREALLSEISDTYKEIYGYRPDMSEFSGRSDSDLENYLERLYSDMVKCVIEDCFSAYGFGFVGFDKVLEFIENNNV